jgi:hypothetical protein
MAKVRDRSPNFFQGFFLALLAIKDVLPGLSVLRNLNLGSLSGFFLSHSIATIAVLGVGLAIMFTILAPITFALLFLSPGLLGQVIVTLAKVATYVANEVNPNSSASIFLDAIAKADPSFGAALKSRYTRAGARRHLGALSSRILGRMFKVGGFLRKDWKSWALGFIPVVGPIIGFAGTSFSSAEDLMKEVLLQPYADSEGWSDERKNQFFYAHKWTLIGFASVTVQFTVGGGGAPMTALINISFAFLLQVPFCLPY